MIEGFSKDSILVCVSHEAALKDISDEAWISGAVYSDRDSDNAKIYTDGITVGKEYRATERIIMSAIVGKGENRRKKYPRPACHDTVSIINDWGSERYYLCELFISKSERRNDRLEELGI